MAGCEVRKPELEFIAKVAEKISLTTENIPMLVQAARVSATELDNLRKELEERHAKRRAEERDRTIARLQGKVGAGMLSDRARAVFKKHKIVTVFDLVSRSRSDLLKLKGFGKKLVEEIVSALASRQLELKKEEPGK